VNKTRIFVGLASLALGVVGFVATHTNDSPWSPRSVVGAATTAYQPLLTGQDTTNDSPWS
jgi:hypothetical protein